MNISRYIPSTAGILASAALMLGGLATSCVDDNSLCVEDRPGYNPNDVVWLSFNLKNMTAVGETGSKTDTRADDESGHPEEDAVPPESHVNTNDINLILFDNNRRLLKIFSPGEFAVVETVSGQDADYTLTFKVNQGYFTYAGTGDVNFSLMVVANLGGTGDTGHGVFTENAFYAKTPYQISESYLGFAYTGKNGNDPWTLEANSRLIPMSGIASMTMTQAQLESSTDATQPLNLGTIDLQRAMAKIRVLDLIQSDPDNTSNMRITGVDIVGFNNRGAYIPHNETWQRGTCVLESATDKGEWFDADAVCPTISGTFSLTENGTTATYPSFVAYTTECQLSNLADNVSPILRIYTNDNINGNRSFNVDVRQIGQTGDKHYTAIARNHIYEYRVSYNWEADVTVSYTVCPWFDQTIDVPPFVDN